MTVKELSKFTGKTERAVRNWVNKANEKSSAIKEKSSVSSPNSPADYEIDEVEQILSCSSLGVNAVCIVMSNARDNQKELLAPLEKSMAIDMEALTKSITIAVVAALSPMMGKIVEYSNTTQYKELLAPKNDRSALRQLIGKYARKHCDGDHQEAWGFLYEEIYYRLKVNIRVRAKNEGVSKLDIIETLGYIDHAYTIVSEGLEG